MRVAAAALTVVFACQGFEIVPVIAGQVRTSARAVPFATVGSLALSVALYVLLVLACVSALPELASSQAPLVDTARALAGPGLAGLLFLGTSISRSGSPSA
jgi:amino acid transporter